MKTKAKNDLQQNTFSRALRTALLLFLQAFVCLLSFTWILYAGIRPALSWMISHPFYTLYTMLLLIWALWLFYVFFHDFRLSYPIVHLLLSVFGVAEYIKLDERKEYIDYADLFIMSDFGETVNGLSFASWPPLLWSLGAMLAMVVLFWCTKKLWKDKRTKKRLVRELISLPVSLLLIIGCLIYPCVKTGMARNVVLGEEGDKKGGIVCFVESIGYQGFYHAYKADIYDEAEKYDTDMPPAATAEQVEKIAVKPNIICVMCESLWDLTQLSDVVEFSEDSLKEFRALAGEYAGGVTTVNVFGGGTDKSEFEFLTGWNSKYLMEKSAYRAFFNAPQQSLVTYLKQLGYISYGVQPYKPNFWNRDVAYANMGFDDFYDWNTMKNQDKYSVYISDKALMQELIDRYEERRAQTDAPVFAFTTTIATHVVKIATGPEGPVRTDIRADYKMDMSKFTADARSRLLKYVNAQAACGEAVQMLIDYFSKIDEPTVIVLFGDHAPSFVTGFEAYLPEDVIKEGFYETPFVVWNNYGLGEFGENYMNIGYLSGKVLEYIGLPLPRQCRLNHYLRGISPVDTRYMVKDASGQLSDTDADAYINRSYGVYNAMYYDLKNISPELELWGIE